MKDDSHSKKKQQAETPREGSQSIMQDQQATNRKSVGVNDQPQQQQQQLDSHQLNLYSRQIGAYGIEAMGALIKMKILIVGVRGLGVEVAKNLILAGPAVVGLYDEEAVQISDCGVNFYVQEEDVGKNRAEVSAVKLQELNRLVKVNVVRGASLTTDVVSNYTCVIVTKQFGEVEKWNEFCRGKNIGFIYAGVHGAMGFVFNDFGDSFKIRDSNGEQPVTRIINSVSNEKEAVVALLPPPDGKQHNIEFTEHEGWVNIEEVEGMGEAINKSGPYKAKAVYKELPGGKQRFDPYSVRIEFDTSALGKYVNNGRLIQVKKPIGMKFQSFKESCKNPGEFLFTDGSKFGRAEQLHAALLGVWDVLKGTESSPVSLPVEDVIKSASKYENFDEDVTKKVAQHYFFEFQPLCAFFGGVVAQEAVKMSGKFTPLHQWLHLDCFEVLPSEGGSLGGGDGAPGKKKQADLIAILGVDVVKKLNNTSTFLVGCGALGCEFLKNFALLGVACGDEDGSAGGLVTVTDNDRIEVSNLSRQFLFREENVGQSKSLAASAAVKKMNPSFRVKALESLVAPNTEGIFNDEFWLHQDFITNALDNVKARLYVDSRCVFYKKPLLESGTLGTKCNVQVVLPYKTQSYSDGPKDTEDADAIPMCTLRNFPSLPEHCIEWGRAQFADLFASSAQEAANYLNDPKGWVQALRVKVFGGDGSGAEGSNRGQIASAVGKETKPLKQIVELIQYATNVHNNTFEECLKDAHQYFYSMFRDKIVALIQAYPESAVDREGKPFWSGAKRFPLVIEKLNLDNQVHFDFIVSMANLFAVNRGLVSPAERIPDNHEWRSKQYVSKVLGGLPTPPIVNLEKVDMSGGGEEEEETGNGNNGKKQKLAPEDDDEKKIEEFKTLLNDLEGKYLQLLSSPTTKKVEACDFEKDHDWNFHIDFIYSASNLRAMNYRLKTSSKHDVKMIAGKIIPAIATTTASVCGLVMIEMLKIVQNKPLEAFKDSSNSLGINGYFFSEPLHPSKAVDEYDPIEMTEVKCIPKGFTKWDKTEIKFPANGTVRDFIELFLKQTGLQLTSISHANANLQGVPGSGQFLYERDAWQKEKKQYYQDECLPGNLSQLLLRVYDLKNYKFLILETSQEDAEGNPCKVPAVVVEFI